MYDVYQEKDWSWRCWNLYWVPLASVHSLSSGLERISHMPSLTHSLWEGGGLAHFWVQKHWARESPAIDYTAGHLYTQWDYEHRQQLCTRIIPLWRHLGRLVSGSWDTERVIDHDVMNQDSQPMVYLSGWVFMAESMVSECSCRTCITGLCLLDMAWEEQVSQTAGDGWSGAGRKGFRLSKDVHWAEGDRAERRGWEMEASRLPESPDSISYHFDAWEMEGCQERLLGVSFPHKVIEMPSFSQPLGSCL